MFFVGHEVEMKINQAIVDSIFFCKLGNAGDYSNLQILKFIRASIENHFGVSISNAEAHEFWRWRSDLYDASFLTVNKSEEVIEYFEKYCIECLDLEEDEEPWVPYEID